MRSFAPILRLRKNVVLGSKLDSITRLFQLSGQLTMADILHVTNAPRTTVGRKLKQLVKEGIIIQIGTGRNTRYQKK